jgi:amino acid transporter
VATYVGGALGFFAAAGVALLTVLYTGANLAYHLTLSSEAIAQERIPAVAVMAKLLPGWGTHIMHVMLWVSVCGALNGNILVGPRVLFALARDYRALSPFKRVPAATGTPALAIVAVCGWSMLLVCLGNLSPDPEVRLFDLLTVYCIFGGSIFYFSAVLAVFVLRITQPEAPRPYRTWGYPWTPALFVVFYVFLLYRMYADRPFECLAGLTFIGIGGVVYLLVSPRGTLGEGK